MKRVKTADPGPQATVGFALGTSREGVAYVSLIGVGLETSTVLRVPFECHALPALEGRDVAYAALTAVATVLRKRDVRSVCLITDAASLIEDYATHRTVPAALTVSYVILGCALNRFASVELAEDANACRDLAARARADASLHVAA